MTEITYAQAGVDRDSRKKAKKFDLFKRGLPNGTLKLPFNDLLPSPRKGEYYLLTADGVGTKVLLAELAGKHDTIGIDAVAMVANDAIRCGATPLDLVNIIDIHHSEPKLLAEILKGISQGAQEAGCRVVGGETADVPSLVTGVGNNPYHINMACYATVKKKQIIDGRGIRPGDAVVGLKSSGLHSNGLSLARRVLFAQWGGYYNPGDYVAGLKKPLLLEALTPTRIYVKLVLAAMKKFKVKAAVHVTGDAYAKFAKLSGASPVGFRFDNFSPQKIFSTIQKAASQLGTPISDREMFRTFNMGWGFALVVSKRDAKPLVKFLEKQGEEAAIIGRATGKKGVVEIGYAGRQFTV